MLRLQRLHVAADGPAAHPQRLRHGGVRLPLAQAFDDLLAPQLHLDLPLKIAPPAPTIARLSPSKRRRLESHRGVVYGNPVIDEIRRRGGIDPEAVISAVAGALRSEFGDSLGRMPLQAIVFSAQKLQ